MLSISYSNEIILHDDWIVELTLELSYGAAQVRVFCWKFCKIWNPRNGEWFRARQIYWANAIEQEYIKKMLVINLRRFVRG